MMCRVLKSYPGNGWPPIMLRWATFCIITLQVWDTLVTPHQRMNPWGPVFSLPSGVNDARQTLFNSMAYVVAEHHFLQGIMEQNCSTAEELSFVTSNFTTPAESLKKSSLDLVFKAICESILNAYVFLNGKQLNGGGGLGLTQGPFGVCTCSEWEFNHDRLVYFLQICFHY